MKKLFISICLMVILSSISMAETKVVNVYCDKVAETIDLNKKLGYKLTSAYRDTIGTTLIFEKKIPYQQKNS